MSYITPNIKQLLAKEAGLNLAVCGDLQIEHAIKRRLKNLNIQTPSLYLSHLLDNQDERQVLIEELTVSETWFFRDRSPFELLAQEAKKIRRKKLILSAPCASGEETYSIAMSLLLHSINDFEVHAIDINHHSIEFAQTGIYHEHSFREKEPEIKSIFFSQQDKRWQVSENLKTHTNFKQGNLCSEKTFAHMPEYDFIFCRNLMIYLQPQACKTMLENLAGKLRPNGLLFTGHSELFKAQTDSLLNTGIRGAFALRKKGDNE